MTWTNFSKGPRPLPKAADAAPAKPAPTLAELLATVRADLAKVEGKRDHFSRRETTRLRAELARLIAAETAELAKERPAGQMAEPAPELIVVAPIPQRPGRSTPVLTAESVADPAEDPPAEVQVEVLTELSGDAAREIDRSAREIDTLRKALAISDEQKREAERERDAARTDATAAWKRADELAPRTVLPDRPPEQHWECYVGPPRQIAAEAEARALRERLLVIEHGAREALRTLRGNVPPQTSGEERRILAGQILESTLAAAPKAGGAS